VEQINHSTKSRKGKHLVYEDRIRIEVLYKSWLTPTCIGEQLDRSRRTIERELALGMYEAESSYKLKLCYSADIAQQKRDINSSGKGPMLKIAKDHQLAKYIENSIKSGFSPYATLQNIKNNNLKFETIICFKTLYSYIDDGLFLGLTNKDLLIKKNVKKRDYHKIRQAITNTKGTSIADRPIEIDNRDEYGNWEMDTVVSKQGTKTVLLVLSERMSRQELIFKMKSKSQSEVIRVIDRLERKHSKDFKQIFKSITTDNGCEFLNFEGIEKSIYSDKMRTKMYFAHPYSSWERGTNENINKMIRRFIPKGVDISVFSNNEVRRIQNWINNYPRKILGGKSSNMLIKNNMAA